MANTTKIPTTKSSGTNWGVFKEAGLVPVKIVCDGYYPIHRANLGCHSKLQLTAEAMINHLDQDHGGGFQITLKRTDGKPWDGWDKLQEAGIEIVDFRCDVCDEVLRLNPMIILRHFAPHSGKTRRPRQGGTFNLTISRTANPDYLEE